MRTVSAIIIAIVTAMVPAAKPPMSHGVTNHYTIQQQQTGAFAACLASAGYDHPLSEAERQAMPPGARDRYRSSFWACFHATIESEPADSTIDSYCMIDGKLHPNGDCQES